MATSFVHGEAGAWVLPFIPAVAAVCDEQVILHPLALLLQLGNGLHCLLPQTVLSGNPPRPFPGTVVTWCSHLTPLSPS